MPIIALTTDFGTRDAYVGALKGVILGIAPHTQIVDVTHEIEPYSVVEGALALKQVWRWFPRGTIHVAVVDPGVGTSRGILVASYGGRYVIAPDNGLVTFVCHSEPNEAAHEIANPKYLLTDISPTFHGRDVIAPVAAHLANGVPISEFGPPCPRIAEFPLPKPLISNTIILGEVLHVDRFGTLVTNIARDVLGPMDTPGDAWMAWIAENAIGRIRSTFSDVAVGETVALIGSSGFLEIAVNRGRAVDRFGKAARIELRSVR